MPPKAKAPKAAQAKPAGPTPQQFCEVLKGGKDAIVNEVTGKPVRKWEAALFVWTYGLSSENKREELFKGQCAVGLTAMMERGQPEERWAACGAIYALAQSDKHIADIITSRVISNASLLLQGEHDRSRQPAAQLLAYLASRLEFNGKVAELALLPLLNACRPGAIASWGGARITALHCLTGLRALTESVQGEVPGSKMARRQTLLAAGAVPVMAALVAYVPRMPEPRQVPAAMPVGKRMGAPKKAGKKGPVSNRPPAGRKDLTATQAAACLRYLALCPNFLEELLATNSLPTMVHGLLTSGEEQAAYLCGILWEITADADVAQKVVDADGVRCLLHVIACNIASTKGKPKAKKKPKDGESTKKGRNDMVPPPLSFPDIAVGNAAGTLNHLTFIDTAKRQVGMYNGAAILVACLKVFGGQTFENATGALWNCGLVPGNTSNLSAAGAPGYLAHPVPDDWLVALQEPLQVPLPEVPGATGPSFFLTQ